VSVLPGGLIGLFLILCLAGSLGWTELSQFVIISYLILIGFLNTNGFDPAERIKQREEWYYPQKKWARYLVIVGFVLLFIISSISVKVAMGIVLVWIYYGYLSNQKNLTISNQLSFHLPNPQFIADDTPTDLTFEIHNNGCRLQNVNLIFKFESKIADINTFEVKKFMELIYANNANTAKLSVNVKHSGIYFISLSASYKDSKICPQKGKGLLVVKTATDAAESKIKKSTDINTSFEFLITQALDKEKLNPTRTRST
jgi:hypothetical protein